ncbi:NADPH-dependent 2,4-dienoyl-CoA reductase [Thalassobaculum sp.]|uniref:NADPH-dependent 2,4-dienoyl-CoA reductase n=1 Tax=Thalassobaculum sp. TaxID=2022740 RepID=UPI0032ECDDEE
MPSPFPLIASPIRVDGVDLRNRIVMGSMHTGLEAEPERFDALARFYGDRARGGAGLIVTGGFAPNRAARVKDHPSLFDSRAAIAPHRRITDAVHGHGGRIVVQLLHAGRYGYHDEIVAPSPVQAPINRYLPAEMTDAQIRQTIGDYAASAALALEAGYDGVEIMGSEGYLISEFLATRTNHRADSWGGSLQGRARFAIEVTAAVRRALGPDPIISYRISAADLIEGGLDDDETQWLARAVEAAGAGCLMTGIGWHESKVPTIAGAVPHAAFAGATARLKAAVSIPVIASNRINLPETAERVLRDGQADMVSMARPFLADAEFVDKALGGRAGQINLCIACNQACLDHYFLDQTVTCLVNPWAVRELERDQAPAARPKRIAVVGAGVAGIACALEAARRSHRVTLYDAAERPGGQLRLAAVVPGKEDYGRAIDNFENQLAAAGVETVYGTAVDAATLAGAGYDEIVLSTGVLQRALDIPGGDDPRVVGYTEILTGRVTAGEAVLVIGGGGIGHDVALFLAHPDPGDLPALAAFEAHWGIGGTARHRPAARRVTMLKRSPGGFGRTLGKSTGWILRQELRDFGVRQIAGVRYLEIDAAGLHVETDGGREILAADTIVVCAGQESNAALATELAARGRPVHVIGGARLAGELDAKRAVDEGARLGNRL